jgi:hypothetical protein
MKHVAGATTDVWFGLDVQTAYFVAALDPESIWSGFGN